MNRLLIIFSILIISLIAFSDARDRFQELNRAAANTPSQVEMKPIFNDNAPSPKFEDRNVQQKQIPSDKKYDGQIDKTFKHNEQEFNNSPKKQSDDIFQ